MVNISERPAEAADRAVDEWRISRYGRRQSVWNDAQTKAYRRCIWLPDIADVRSSTRGTPDVMATEVTRLQEALLVLGLEDVIPLPEG
jgi:hypothetical protein